MTSSDDSNSSKTAPSERLSQVAGHVAPRKRRVAKAKSELPADYSDILGQLESLKTIARSPDTKNKGYVRQKQAGKLWVRERVLELLDEGSFHEVGSVSGTVQWKKLDGTKEEPESYIPSNNVQGFGTLRGRRVVFTADDFSIRAGHADGALMEKTIYMEKLAVALKLPIIKLVDGSSGGGSVTTIKTAGYSYIPPMPSFKHVAEQLNLGIPNLGAVLGPAIGLGAARVVACHFSVMAADVGALFNAGPKVVAGATFEEGLSFTDLGGPSMHCTNGTIDNLAANEQECFEQLRTVLSYLPNSGSSLPPVLPSDDPADRLCEELRSIIPRRKARMYDPRKIITTVVDIDSWFEIGALWGTTAIVGLARLGGRPVGIISLNCEVNAGALDAAGSQKITRHLKFCDSFNIPILQFVDVPGYAIGTNAERTATMRHGIALATTYFSTTTPVFSVVTRRVYGVAGGIMLDCRDPRMRIAWPSGEWGSLPLDGGIEVGHAAELKAIKDKDKREARYKDLEEEYTRLMNPVRTANAFGVEEIIDPALTRPIAAEWLKHVYDELLPSRLLDRANGKIHPIFY
ncbi:carboxyl transferase [Cadophora sp. MPI-SDFR-AT-0126]|nr:carboxyl transferase [Leotiomycetes sp. MPI-SDFR-AT-0126]